MRHDERVGNLFGHFRRVVSRQLGRLINSYATTNLAPRIHKPLTYTYPKSTPITFRIAAAAAFCGAILFAAAYYQAFQVAVGSALVEYGACSPKAFSLNDINKISVDAVRGRRVITVALQSGERHFLPGDLAKFSDLADELGKRSNTTVARFA